jgi:hypothetical protein
MADGGRGRRARELCRAKEPEETVVGVDRERERVVRVRRSGEAKKSMSPQIRPPLPTKV